MAKAAAPLADHPHVAEVRQHGMILAMEMVKDKKARGPYPWQERRGLTVHQPWHEARRVPASRRAAWCISCRPTSSRPRRSTSWHRWRRKASISRLRTDMRIPRVYHPAPLAGEKRTALDRRSRETSPHRAAAQTRRRVHHSSTARARNTMPRSNWPKAGTQWRP